MRRKYLLHLDGVTYAGRLSRVMHVNSIILKVRWHCMPSLSFLRQPVTGHIGDATVLQRRLPSMAAVALGPSGVTQA